MGGQLYFHFHAVPCLILLSKSDSPDHFALFSEFLTMKDILNIKTKELYFVLVYHRKPVIVSFSCLEYLYVVNGSLLAWLHTSPPTAPHTSVIIIRLIFIKTLDHFSLIIQSKKWRSQIL